MRNGAKLLLVALATLVCASAALAQTPTGIISGKVTDPQSAAVSGAAVKITEKATGREVTLTANEEGFFEARSLTPGSYDVRIEQTGFSAGLLENVVVQTGQNTDASLQLTIGNVAEVVTVEGGAADVQVDTIRQTVDGVVTAEKIQQLPLAGRNFLDLGALQPSVVVVDGGQIDPTKVNAYRAVRVNGSSGTGTRVQIDGIDVTDETVGSTTANVSTDAVQEFQLSRSSFDLSTSLTTTGAVNINTKSGGNRFHGTGFYFHKDESPGARQEFLTEKLSTSRTQQGGSFGGPIFKNRLFFFGSGEHSSEQSLATVRFNPPFEQFGGEAPLPIRFRYWTGRVDGVVNNNVKLFYSHRYNDDISTGGTIASPFQNVDWTIVHVIGADITGGRMTHSIRAGHVNFNNRIESKELAGFPFIRSPQGIPFQVNVNDVSAGPNGLAPQQTYQDNKQFKYDGSYTLDNHTLRFGGEINKILLGGFANFAGPAAVTGDFPATPVGAANDPLSYPLVAFGTGPNSGFFTATPAHGLPFGGHANTRYAWYAGDAWRVRPNLNLNLGVRWNYENNFFSKGAPSLPSIEVYGPGKGAVAKFPKDAFSPQVGFAWDPKGDGKMSIRGGFYLAYEMNIFNNALFDEFARNASGIGPTALSIEHVVDPNGNPIVVPVSAIACPGAASGNYECLLGLPIRATLTDLGNIHTAVQGAYSAAFGTYDPNVGPSEFDVNAGNTFGGQFPGDYKIPYSMQFSIGFQRELFRNHVISVDYVRNRGVGLPYLLGEYELRRDSRFFDEAAARTRVAAALGIPVASLNADTVSGRIAQINAQRAADHLAPLNINNFSLANDVVWPGRTAQNTRARLLAGGYSLYNGLQVLLNGRFSPSQMDFASVGDRPLVRGLNYTISYALSRAEATSGSNRSEFITNPTNNRNWNVDFGPTGLDRTHILGAGVNLETIGGFQLNQFWRFSTSPPVNLLVPYLDTFSSTNYLFTTDINGDGGHGTTTRGDLLPGTKIGALGRDIQSFQELNQVITSFNQRYAGQPTPQGQRLIDAGIFTLDQLRQIGAVIKPIPLVPENNPWPFQNRLNLDLRITRPIRLFGENGVRVLPILEIFNVFNNSPKGTYAGLNGAFGALNFPYSAESDRADLDQFVRGLTQPRRQIQFGLRVEF